MAVSPAKPTTASKPADPWAGLMTASKRPNAASERDEIRWATANIYVPLDQIDLTTVPSMAAVSLLRTYRDRPDQLFDKLYTKILPSKEEVNRLSLGSDDGVELVEYLETIAAAAEAARKDPAE